MFEELLPTELKFLAADPPSETLSAAVKAKHYFTILQRQDELTETLVKVIYRIAKVDKPTPSAEEVIGGWRDNIKGNGTIVKGINGLMTYVRDTIYLKKYPSETTPKSRAKLDDIIHKQTNSARILKLSDPTALFTQEILELMLYPKRMINIFIESLVNIINSLRNDKTILEPILNTKNSAIKGELILLLATQYTAYVISNAFDLTNHDAWDSYSAISTKGGAAQYTKFFYDFLTEIVSLTESTTNNITSFGTLAGIVYKTYISSPDNLTLTFLEKKLTGATLSTQLDKTTFTTQPPPPGTYSKSYPNPAADFYGLPEYEYLTQQVAGKFTFENILVYLGAIKPLQEHIEKLHFLIHLLYKLEHSTPSETLEEEPLGIASLFNAPSAGSAASTAEATPASSGASPAAAAVAAPASSDTPGAAEKAASPAAAAASPATGPEQPKKPEIGGSATPTAHSRTLESPAGRPA